MLFRSYAIQSSYTTHISDADGNDTYSVSSNSNEVTIRDYKGKEAYKLNNSYNIGITDYTGIDSYKLSDIDTATILDKDGKDKFDIKNVRYLSCLCLLAVLFLTHTCFLLIC